MTTKRHSPEELGRIVWDAVDAAGSEGINRAGILEATGLSVHQFRAGYQWIRELFRHEQEQPIIVTPAPNYHYVLTANIPDCDLYNINTLLSIRTRLEMAKGNVVVRNARFGSKFSAMVVKTFGRSIEDIDDLVDLLAAEGEAL